MYVDMACIVMYDNISIARSKSVNEKVVLCYTVQDEDQFPCKSSGLWIISYDRYGLHNNVLLGHIIGCFTRNKRVNEYITCLCTSLEENWFTCKISGSLVLWLVCFDMDLVCITMYCQDT